MASAACAEDQLEWCGLIESKVRLLIMTLERNQHIVLAHVNPECYPGMPPAPDTPSTPANMWFIGLVFAKTENLNVDLTYDIQHFTNQVYRQAGKMIKENMKMEARHVRRKQLAAYLPANLLKRERKVSTSSSTTSNVNGSTSPQLFATGDSTNRKRHSDSSVDSTIKKSKQSFDGPDESPNNTIIVHCNTDDSNSALSEDDRLYRPPLVNDSLSVSNEENTKEEVVCT